MIISLIAAMAKNRVIGYQGKMPWHLPADLKHFKKITLNKPIIMGRKTFQSIGRALPLRRNIVVTRDSTFSAPGIEIANNIEAALKLAGAAPEVMIIGSRELYKEAMNIADCLYLTLIDAQFPGDTFFPAYEQDNWREVSNESHVMDAENPYSYRFVIYKR